MYYFGVSSAGCCMFDSSLRWSVMHPVKVQLYSLICLALCFGIKHYIASRVDVINVFCYAGFIAFIISVAVFILLALVGVPVHIVYHKFLPLAVTSIVFSYILALFLYLKSLHAESSALAEGGSTGKSICGVLMYCLEMHR